MRLYLHPSSAPRIESFWDLLLATFITNKIVTMARPQTITDAEIVATAREVFLEMGPATSVSVVAQRLGVSHAALFHRVGSKEALLQQALLLPPPPLVTEPWPTPMAEDFEPKLVERLAKLMAFLREVVPSLMMLRASGTVVRSQSQPPHQFLRQQLARHLAAASEAGICDLRDTNVVAEAVLGAIEANCFNAFVGGEASTPRKDLSFVRKLVRGLVTAPTERGGAT